ncbi:hypothetical protein [Mumia sp. DW29H23]|uniref:hypothetical protein n=1 Tax=Mumia sp. DW29H23 TaxID=3421241 RepID=UPI003D68B67E
MRTNEAPVVVGVASATEDDAALWFAAGEAERQGRPILLVHAYRDNPTTRPRIR